MARRVIWSPEALDDVKAIFVFWNEHNKSKVFSRKLRKLNSQETDLLKNHPLMGKKTSKPNVYVKVIKKFLFFYEVNEKEIVIQSFWDERRNPDDKPLDT